MGEGRALRCSQNSLVSSATANLRPRFPRSQTQGREPKKKPVDSKIRERYLEDDHWIELAKKFGVTLPRRNTACTRGRMETWLRRLGFDSSWYQEWTGFSTLQEHIEANPTWSLRAWVGLLLEEKESAQKRG